MTMEPPVSCCVIVPAYNEAARIGDVLRRIREHAPHVDMLVIDDGSSDETERVAREHGAAIIRHGKNTGKGTSLLDGFGYVREKGYEVVITLDADGQHDPAEIPRFIGTWQRTRIPVLIGNRMWDRQKMPVVRRWINRWMSWIISRIMSVYVPDTQCGFRLFRTELLSYVSVSSSRFAMESEMLLAMAARGFRMDSVRIPVLYGEQISRIHPLLDSWRFLKMLAHHHRARRMREG